LRSDSSSAELAQILRGAQHLRGLRNICAFVKNFAIESSRRVASDDGNRQSLLQP